MDRRRFLQSSVSFLSLAGGVSLPLSRAFAATTRPEAGEAFSFDILTERMRAKAKEAWQKPESPLPEKVQSLTYDQHRAIRFRPDHSLWRDTGARYQLQAFHPGWLFKQPVTIYEVRDDRADPVAFTGHDFRYDAPLDETEFDDFEMPGVAGFRLHYPLKRPDYMDEVVAFLGASYFRALGRQSVYGLSSRGLAIDTASSEPEEFPAFTAFYIAPPGVDERTIRLWASLESPRVTGAYAFEITPGDETVVDVTARLFFRNRIDRLGVAPLTSMYLFGENDDRGFDDYRPEVHDSDTLVILNGNDEQAVRPLRNPGSLRVSFFRVANPKGFGLAQRDREFGNYQDLEAHYERRPTAWIEPLNDWGQGRVVLAEIPSDSETNDNIVAFWQPAKEPEAGDEREYRYRMRWGDRSGSTDLAEVIATHTGHGGVAGLEIDPEMRKFVVDFRGGVLSNLPKDAAVKPHLEASNAEIVSTVVQRMPHEDCWRLIADVRRSSDDPVELRAYLTFEDARLSETWLYQWSVE
ncbi:glucan biosynthesis protein D [Rhodobium orientis]|uniref:Glucan biosynthesis protein D n=1 Tax=Rhodobium orientis TaxID=34017 RepID=A0A327JSS2_9HYPH|nr:glucan biosynthesis protein G [Rhodobium orientis]MBK5950781.1 glucan biosynthesis protein D [Rhodobium orientis]RAI29549.1 glucan biosynthesis protein D [Rhodobium orientis]